MSFKVGDRVEYLGGQPFLESLKVGARGYALRDSSGSDTAIVFDERFSDGFNYVPTMEEDENLIFRGVLEEGVSTKDRCKFIYNRHLAVVEENKIEWID